MEEEEMDELGVPNVPPTLLMEYAKGNLRWLLHFWWNSIAPIPEDDFDESHPMYPSALYTNYAIEALGEQLLTPEQQRATNERVGLYNPELPLARA